MLHKFERSVAKMEFGLRNVSGMKCMSLLNAEEAKQAQRYIHSQRIKRQHLSER